MISLSRLVERIFKKYAFQVPLFIKQRCSNYLLNRFTMQADNAPQKFKDIDLQIAYKNKGLIDITDTVESNGADRDTEKRAIDIISQYTDKDNENFMFNIKNQSTSSEEAGINKAVQVKKEGFETGFEHINKAVEKSTDKGETSVQIQNRGTADTNNALENENQTEKSQELQYVKKKLPIISLLEKAALYQDAGFLTIDTSLAARQTVDSRNLKALTIGKSILLGSNYSNIENIRTREVLAHEMRHVEQFLNSNDSTYAGKEKISQLEAEARDAQNEILSETESIVKKGNPDFIESNLSNMTVAYSHNKKDNLQNQFSDVSVQKSLTNIYPVQKAIRSPNSIFNKDIIQSFEHRVKTSALNSPTGLLKSAESLPLHGSKTSASINFSPTILKMGAVTAKSRALPAMAASEEPNKPVVQEKSSSTSHNSEQDLESLTEELYQRISDRLVTERERFMK